jgi:hypothetical protein
VARVPSAVPHPPSPSTLAKYGLLAKDWWRIWKRQGEGCPVCDKTWDEALFVIDHEHVPGWKKMRPVERRRYVRGIVCNSCNHFVLTRYGTVKKHLGAAKYLRRYERRRR